MAYNIKNCEDADQLIQKALDGMLNSEERQALDSHIEACQACAAAWEEHRTLSRLATAWARRPAAADSGASDFTSAVLAQIAKRSIQKGARAVPPIAIRLAAACAVFLLVALSYFLSPALFPLWTPPHVPPLSPNTPATVWSSLIESVRALPSDALTSWNSLLSEHVSYYPALAAAAGALSLALFLALQSAQRPRGRA